MGVNLSKGQRVSLDKGMTMCLIGLGWDTNRYDGGYDFDLDAAAFMLGAEGVQCGTRFLSAFECGIHANYKKKVLDARDIDTQVTGRKLGHPVRALRNPFVNKFAELERDPNVTEEELSAFGTGAVRKAAVDGNLQEGSFLAGQIAALVKQEQSAQEIVDDLVRECEALLSKAAERVL